MSDQVDQVEPVRSVRELTDADVALLGRVVRRHRAALAPLAEHVAALLQLAEGPQQGSRYGDFRLDAAVVLLQGLLPRTILDPEFWEWFSDVTGCGSMQEALSAGEAAIETYVEICAQVIRQPVWMDLTALFPLAVRPLGDLDMAEARKGER